MNVAEWNKLNIRERKRLVKEAGHAPNNYAYRAFNVIPRHIQDDIQYVIRREQAKAEASHVFA